jgi:mutator protein MutT
MSAEFPIPAVRAVIENEKGQVLLVKRNHSTHGNEFWCLPGGKVDAGETVEASLVREVLEEIGIPCLSKKFLFYQDSLPFEKGKMHCIVFYFLCAVSGTIQLNDESCEYAWVGKDRLDQYPVAFRNDEGIRRYWKMKEQE